MIKLVKPTLFYKEQIIAYRQSFLENNEKAAGTGGLEKYEQIEEWLKAVENNSHIDTLTPGLVVASLYLAIRASDNQVVGMIDIRHYLNDHLFNSGGHIGYSVIKSERQKGYAKEMLKQALKICKELQITKVLITCDEGNIASEKTILSCGGVFENRYTYDNGVVKRFWITL